MMRNRVGVFAGLVVVAMVAGGCSGADRDAAPRSTATTDQIDGAKGTPTTVATNRKRPSGLFSLSAFASCNSLLKHVKAEALKVVTPYGLPGAFGGSELLVGRAESASVGLSAATADSSAAGTGGSAGPKSSAAPSFSGTNVQEEGVDEPDIIKSDGRRLVTIARNELHIADITGKAPKHLGTLDFPADTAMPGEMLLLGDRVVVFSSAHYGGRVGPGVLEDRAVGSSAGASSRWAGWSQSSVVRIVDISDPAKPEITSTLTLEGQYVSARMVGGIVRMVVTSQPGNLPMAYPLASGEVGEREALESNKAAIERSTIADWLPEYRLERKGKADVTEVLASCAAVLRPKDFSGLGTVSVLTLDPANPQPVSPSCVLGGGGVVYASTENVYVATQRWMGGPAAVDSAGGSSMIAPPPTASIADTLLHQFATPGGKPAEYVASGELPGTVLNQFSMSEHEGKLRVATTTRRGNGSTESFVQVLEAKDDGKLAVIGKIGGLGHEGETIQSVRFIGDRGYVVTFRQTDPLYVLDLSDATRPKVTGELKIPGFSSYLHPLSDDVLIGIGQGPDEQGGQGLQLSLFDVADPARPVRTANLVLANTSSEAQQDHHAFLWWPETKQLVVPTTRFSHGENDAPEFGASVFTVDVKGGFGPPRKISHAPHFSTVPDSYQLSSIRRSMVVGSALLTMSEGGLRSSDLVSLAEQGWLAW